MGGDAGRTQRCTGENVIDREAGQACRKGAVKARLAQDEANIRQPFTQQFQRTRAGQAVEVAELEINDPLGGNSLASCCA